MRGEKDQSANSCYRSGLTAECLTASTAAHGDEEQQWGENVNVLSFSANNAFLRFDLSLLCVSEMCFFWFVFLGKIKLQIWVLVMICINHSII